LIYLMSPARSEPTPHALTSITDTVLLKEAEARLNITPETEVIALDLKNT